MSKMSKVSKMSKMSKVSKKFIYIITTKGKPEGPGVAMGILAA